ncbi:MAG TPA: hypothetical protein VJJ82_02080 [Candidatus Nanoarchaeia archaeon]|nr:hypothetical protein [Candidatus Nanoarchaeia archaeon]
MRDATHMEHVVRWARFVKENPTKWKAQHTEFINAIYEKAGSALDKITQMPGGKEKMRKLRELRIKAASSR